MSDKEATNTPTKAAGKAVDNGGGDGPWGLTPREQNILSKAITCLKHPFEVDYNRLAEACGMGNPRSASNAWSGIKKKLVEHGALPTPVKKTPGKQTPGKRKAAAAKEDDEDDEDAATANASPSKKPRARARKPATPKKAAAATKKKTPAESAAEIKKEFGLDAGLDDIPAMEDDNSGAADDEA